MRVAPSLDKKPPFRGLVLKNGGCWMLFRRPFWASLPCGACPVHSKEEPGQYWAARVFLGCSEGDQRPRLPGLSRPRRPNRQNAALRPRLVQCLSKLTQVHPSSHSLIHITNMREARPTAGIGVAGQVSMKASKVLGDELLPTTMSIRCGRQIALDEG